jgi:antirestriction protein ArdC
LQPGLACDPAPLPERKIVPIAEALIAATGVDLRVGGDKAYYAPSADYVAVPPQVAFFDQINYYRTCLHETIHWSGHRTRLDRTFGKRFGDQAYAMEELVAELGAAMICGELGLPTAVHDSHASYIDHWLRILKAERSAIFVAATKAEQAVTFLRTFATSISMAA